MENRENDRLYMHRCLQLAACGRGRVSPNPMVGAVIVCDGRIIGEGYHRQFGGPHAEVNAVNSVRESGLLARSTLYVSLEPCSHYGKTPPCCRLIIEKKIPRVVVGCLDPFPSVSGRGVSMLREAGVEVVTGVLESECRALNAVFMTAHERQRPYVMLKWAQSRDGFIYRRRVSGESAYRFSDSQTLLFSHRLRAEYDAILVGSRTVWLDDPSLTLRLWPGRRSPLRVVIGENVSFPASAGIFSDGVPTEIFTSQPAEDDKSVRYTVADFSRPVIPQVLNALYREGIIGLLVEGGTATLQSFIDAGLWDEARIETAPVELGDGVAAPVLSCAEKRFAISYGLHLVENFSRTEKLS